jgi:hypothetical protein
MSIPRWAFTVLPTALTAATSAASEAGEVVR